MAVAPLTSLLPPASALLMGRWRDFVAAHQRRPNTSEITRWHAENAARHWGADAPSAKAAKQHANCLRPVEQVRESAGAHRGLLLQQLNWVA